jgi:hypothetical protein
MLSAPSPPAFLLGCWKKVQLLTSFENCVYVGPVSSLLILCSIPDRCSLGWEALDG